MASRKSPGSLGVKGYTSSGTVDSDEYAPRNGAKTVTLVSNSTTAGTSQVFLRLGGVDGSLGAAIAQAANAHNTFEVDMSLHKVGTLFLRFTDTDASAGSVNFRASDNA